MIGDRAIRNMLRKFLKFAGIKKRIPSHKLRHSHVALLIYMGKTSDNIKLRLRYKNNKV